MKELIKPLSRFTRRVGKAAPKGETAGAIKAAVEAVNRVAKPKN